MTLTPEQFNKLTTKDDFNRLEERFNNMEDHMQFLLTALDGLAKEVRDMNLEFKSNQVAHDRFETRITKLEKVCV